MSQQLSKGFFRLSADDDRVSLLYCIATKMLLYTLKKDICNTFSAPEIYLKEYSKSKGNENTITKIKNLVNSNGKEICFLASTRIQGNSYDYGLLS